MQARTAFRLAMLANGYQPLLNDCKRPIEKGWPTRVVDEAEVRSWDRSALASTGMKIDGDLAVIDVDVSEADLVAALADAFEARFPELFTRGLVRHAGGAKEAWIARVDEPFKRLPSRRWYRGSDPDDPAVAEAHGRMLRFARNAAVRDRRAAQQERPGRGDQHLPVRRRRLAGNRAAGADLPVLPQAAYALACDLFDGIAAAAGLTAVKIAERSRDGTMCFELDADTEVETQRLRGDDGRRAGALSASTQGARQCADDAALFGQLPRSDPGAD